MAYSSGTTGSWLSTPCTVSLSSHASSSPVEFKSNCGNAGYHTPPGTVVLSPPAVTNGMKYYVGLALRCTTARMTWLAVGWWFGFRGMSASQECWLCAACQACMLCIRLVLLACLQLCRVVPNWVPIVPVVMWSSGWYSSKDVV